MLQKTLKEIRAKTRSTPYKNTKLTVQIIDANQPKQYTNREQKEKVFLECAVSDGETPALLRCYNNELFDMFVTGNALTLKHIIYRDDEIVVTGMSTAYRVKSLIIPENVATQAIRLLRPALITVAEIKKLSHGVKVKLKGQVTKVRSLRSINI